MAQPTRYNEMVSYLEAMIVSGAFAPGDKLPVQRELCSRFALTQGTVGRGLAVLERRGLIRQRRGAGAFVCRPQESRGTARKFKIGILIEEFSGGRTYCGHILRGVQTLAAERKCELSLNFTAYTDFNADALTEYAEPLDGILLIGVYDTTAPLLPKTRPCVGINMHRSYAFASNIDLDPIAAAEQAARYFRESGVSRVVCYTVSPNGQVPGQEINNTFKFRAHMFQAVWPGECMLCDCTGNGNEDPAARLSPGTGFLFASGSHCEQISRAYERKHGRRLSDDAPVLSIDGKSLLVPEYRPVDTIATDYFAMGQVALDECLRRIAVPGAGPRRIYQHVYLVRREDHTGREQEPFSGE